jgi:hypothetical protein
VRCLLRIAKSISQGLLDVTDLQLIRSALAEAWHNGLDERLPVSSSVTHARASSGVLCSFSSCILGLGETRSIAWSYRGHAALGFESDRRRFRLGEWHSNRRAGISIRRMETATCAYT